MREFIITIFSENHIGLLNRITIIFTRRHINIESLAVSESAIKGIHKFTIVVKAEEPAVSKVVKQIEKQVEVLKAYYHTEEETIFQEIALYKVPTDALLANTTLEKIIRAHNARILEITKDYCVVEKMGHKEETEALFKEFWENGGVLQFTRSGRIAVTKSKHERFSDYLKEIGLYDEITKQYS